MCGRFALVTEKKKISGQFDIQEMSSDFRPSGNVSPGQYISVIIQQNGQNIIRSFLWGLIPSWSKDPAIGQKLINARAETVGEKPAFREALKQRRCLIIADGFYEWKKEGKQKIPFYFYLKSEEPFGIAGLYETWLSPDKRRIDTCTIITTNANTVIAPVHDRMPVIISREKEQMWLGNRTVDRAALLSMLKPYPADAMVYKTGMLSHNVFDHLDGEQTLK